MKLSPVETTRREALSLAAIAGLAALLAPKMSLADEGAVAAEIKKLFGDRKIESGKIKLDVPRSRRTASSFRSTSRSKAR